MKTAESILDKSRNAEKGGMREYVLLYVAIVFLFLAIGPRIFSSNWVGSGDFYSCIEIIGSFIGLIAGVACLMYFFGLENRFYLIVGLGFFIASSEGLIHGILAFEGVSADTGINFSRFIPGTYVAGRITLAIMIIAAPLLEHLVKKATNVKREALLYSSLAVALGGGLTVVALNIDLPQFIYPHRLISRPIDFISAMLFLIAFGVVWKRYAANKDIFSGMLLASILFNFGGQVYMSFSKQLYDGFFALAHYANVFSYITPVLGISLQGLEEIRKSNHEIFERRRAEKALASSNLRLGQMIKKLTQSNRELQDFVYVASHDLREPLRAISSLGQLLQESLEDRLDDDDKENLDFMIDGAGRMTQMIEALLMYSRIHARASKPQVIDLNEVLGRLEHLELAALLEEAQGTILVSEPLPVIKGDPAQISQLLQNLIGNALKFQKPGAVPEVVIRTSQSSNDMVRVEIHDNGIGIEEEYCEDIFTMFKRMHPREEYEGAGIGLSICRKIVERHGGEIGVSSTPGSGSVFWFTIPLAEMVEVAV